MLFERELEFFLTTDEIWDFQPTRPCKRIVEGAFSPNPRRIQDNRAPNVKPFAALFAARVFRAVLLMDYH